MAAQGLFDLIGDMDNGIVKRFLTGSDDTGRFIAKFSSDMQENMHNAEGFLHRIGTNALTAKKLDPQQK